MIPLCTPDLTGNEWAYVKNCLDTGWVSSVGSYVDRFEADMAAKLGAARAVATVNGTSALHVALLVAGVRPGDEVLVSTLTFIAPVNAVRYADAHPVLVDAEPTSWQMDVRRVVEFLDQQCHRVDGELINKQTGRRVAALLPVHILGNSVDLAPLLDAARRHGLPVIEDATEGLGAFYDDRPLGTLGDIGCYSFNGNKLLTTGGGGMIATGRADWAQRAKHLTTQAKCDPVEYTHDEIGYNYRLVNVLAAIGCAQLERLDEYVAAKQRIARRYADAFAGVRGLTVMPESVGCRSCFWLYTVLVDADGFGRDSRGLMAHLADKGIQTRPLWQPVHLGKAHQGAQMLGGAVAEGLWRDALSLPCSVHLSTEDQDRVIAEVLAARCR